MRMKGRPRPPLRAHIETLMAGHQWTARRCFALKKNGEPCFGRALANGRCKFHSGMITPYYTRPISPEGKERIAASMRAYWARVKSGEVVTGKRNARVATPRPPEAKTVKAGPDVVLSPEDIQFGYLTGMLKKPI